MNLATTCPSCGTCFRVVQDQLKVSEGWVRCGHCQHVFNALEGLFELDPLGAGLSAPPHEEAPPSPEPATPAPAPSSTPTPVPAQEPASNIVASQPSGEVSEVSAPAAAVPVENEAEAPPAVASAEESAGMDVTAREAASISDAAATEASSRQEPLWHEAAPSDVGATTAPPSTTLPQNDPDTTEPPLAEAGESGWMNVDAFVTEPEPAPVPPVSPLQWGSTTPLVASDASSSAPASAAEGDGPPLPGRPVADDTDITPEEMPPPPSAAPAEVALPDFVRAVEQRARWQRPSVRGALSGVAVALLLTLASQWILHDRNRIAAMWPTARPVLAWACEQLGCQLHAPRAIDALVVENAALARPPGVDGYRLTVNLHNRADFPVAAPHLELALSDTDGSVVVRRVLAPDDFQVDTDAAIGAQSEVTWALELSTGQRKVSGYTVAAFYP